MLCIILRYKNHLQSLTTPTNAYFCFRVVHSSLAPTCFGVTAIIKERTRIMLKLTAIKYESETSIHLCNQYAK